MDRTKKLFIPLLSLALIAAACLAFWPEREAVLIGTDMSAAMAAGSGVATGGPAPTADYYSSKRMRFFESDSLLREREIGSDRRSLNIFTTEVVDGIAHEFVNTYTTSYRILEVSSRSAYVIYVVGQPDRGGTVVERWSFKNVSGSLVGDRGALDPVSGAPIVPPIGIPSPPPTPSTSVAGGGVYVAPSVRHEAMTVRRNVIVHEPDLLHRASAVDPEGRFFMLILSDGQLRKYLLDGTGGYAVVADEQQLPALQHVEGAMNRMQHQTMGRVWSLLWSELILDSNGDVLTVPDTDYQTVYLHDTDNDGVFELIEALFEGDPLEGVIWDWDLIDGTFH